MSFNDRYVAATMRLHVGEKGKRQAIPEVSTLLCLVSAPDARYSVHAPLPKAFPYTHSHVIGSFFQEFPFWLSPWRSPQLIPVHST